MIFQIAKENVIEAIDYFKELDIVQDDMTFLYLMSKHMGVTTTVPVTFAKGKLDDSQKDEYLRVIWLLGGLFDSTEMCETRGIMFPSMFKKLGTYQPGTDFSSVLGRTKDTVEKKNIKIALYNDNDTLLTLKINYKDVLEENFLNGNKISLAHLAAWILRFTTFEFDETPNEKQFSRVVEKTIRKFLKIKKNDFLWLFENDLSVNRLSPATTGITGVELRAQFAFDSGKEPEVTAPTSTAIKCASILPKAVTAQYLELRGDNPSQKDIMNILMQKKQIVLTGVPGVGKSRFTQELEQDAAFDGEVKTIQFHANYSYEDFIGSETLTESNGTTVVTTRKGVLLDFVEKARAGAPKKFLLIIDELNRGNIASIFGEAILALDRSYTAELAKEYEGVSTLKLPENLYIVGTMNTSDRNIAFLDLAIRRRFAFVALLPNYDFLSESVVLEDYDLGNVLKMINARIVETLSNSELIMGQSYFIPPVNGKGDYVWSKDDFKNQFNFVLLPTLREYCFNNIDNVSAIVGEALADGLQETDEFFDAFNREFF